MKGTVGAMLREARRREGLSQAEVATRMGTTQSALSRVEAGWVEPSLSFLERFADAVGRPLTITVGTPRRPPLDPAKRRARVRRALGDYVFDPWRRNPSPAEARTLEADGLTRERFESRSTPPARG